MMYKHIRDHLDHMLIPWSGQNPYRVPYQLVQFQVQQIANRVLQIHILFQEGY